VEVIVLPAGSDPSSGELVLRLTESSGGSYRRQWQAVAGGDYTVLVRTNDRVDGAVEWDRRTVRVQ
jgi:hypothetical protein